MTGSHVMAATGTARVLPLRAEHLDDVLAIEAHASPAGWTRAVFLNELAQPDSRCYLVAEMPGHGVVGFAGAQLLTDEAHVTTVAVAPDHRRRGLASRLMVGVLREVRARGARAATLEVRARNTAAQRLYARFGFRPVGIRPRYYDGRVDALIMWAHDVDGPEFGHLLDRLDAALTGPPAAASDRHGDH